MLHIRAVLRCGVVSGVAFTHAVQAKVQNQRLPVRTICNQIQVSIHLSIALAGPSRLNTNSRDAIKINILFPAHIQRTSYMPNCITSLGLRLICTSCLAHSLIRFITICRLLLFMRMFLFMLHRQAQMLGCVVRNEMLAKDEDDGISTSCSFISFN